MGVVIASAPLRLRLERGAEEGGPPGSGGPFFGVRHHYHPLSLGVEGEAPLSMEVAGARLFWVARRHPP